VGPHGCLRSKLSTLEALLFVSPDEWTAALARATGIELARIEPLLESLRCALQGDGSRDFGVQMGSGPLARLVTAPETARPWPGSQAMERTPRLSQRTGHAGDRGVPATVTRARRSKGSGVGSGSCAGGAAKFGSNRGGWSGRNR